MALCIEPDDIKLDEMQMRFCVPVGGEDDDENENAVDIIVDNYDRVQKDYKQWIEENSWRYYLFWIAPTRPEIDGCVTREMSKRKRVNKTSEETNETKPKKRRAAGPRKCKGCRKTGHNIKTCPEAKKDNKDL